MRKHIQAECFQPDTCGGTCYGCTLAVCKVCGAFEGSLTTECPGVTATEQQQDQVYKSDLNFVDGAWKRDGSSMRTRHAEFER